MFWVWSSVFEFGKCQFIRNTFAKCAKCFVASDDDEDDDEIDVVTVDNRPKRGRPPSRRTPVTITVSADPFGPCPKRFHVSLHQQQHNYAAPLPWHGSRGWLWWVGACEQTATSRYFILSLISAFFTCHIRLWGLQRAASELSGEKAERWPSLEVPGASGGDSRSVCYLKDLEGGDSDTGDGILAAAAREATASSSGEEKTQSQTTTASPQDQCITELLKSSLL